MYYMINKMHTLDEKIKKNDLTLLKYKTFVIQYKKTSALH